MVTGFEDLDTFIGEFSGGNLIILAGEHSQGKTSLALDMACGIASGGDSVVVHSLEMNENRVRNRLISSLARIPTGHLANGSAKAEKWPNLLRAVAMLDKLPIHITKDHQLSLRDMRVKLSRYEVCPKVLIVDYLQLMLPYETDSIKKNQHLWQIVRGLKLIARDLDIAVVLVVQIKVDRGGGNTRPLLSDLEGDGILEETADVVMFLYRDEYYNPDSDDKGIAEVIIGKHRNGPTGKINLAWLEQYTQFASLTKKRRAV